MPRPAVFVQELAQADSPHLRISIAQQAARDQQLDEPVQVGVLLDQSPIEPAHLVVLAVRIVIAVLRSTHLVSHYDHRHTQRKQGDGQQVLHLPVTQSFDLGIARGAFDPAVPA
jgi:hypothetical protein